jgi:rod shape-determining protein MreD
MAAPILVRVARSFGTWLPFVLGLLAVLVYLMPLTLPGGLEMTPLYPLIVVYFWGTHRPDLMTPLPIFLTGITMDFLSGAPLGLWAIVFLASHAFALLLRASFAVALRSAWAGFAVTCGFACTLAFALGSIYYWSLLNPLAFAVQALMSIAVYPFLGLFFAFVERRVLAAVRV